MNKLRLSAYLCTPSGAPSLSLAQFVHSAHLFPNSACCKKPHRTQSMQAKAVSVSTTRFVPVHPM